MVTVKDDSPPPRANPHKRLRLGWGFWRGSVCNAWAIAPTWRNQNTYNPRRNVVMESQWSQKIPRWRAMLLWWRFGFATTAWSHWRSHYCGIKSDWPLLVQGVFIVLRKWLIISSILSIANVRSRVAIHACSEYQVCSPQMAEISFDSCRSLTLPTLPSSSLGRYEADRQETGRWLKTDYTLGIVDFVEYRWSQSLIAPIRVLLHT